MVSTRWAPATTTSSSSATGERCGHGADSIAGSGSGCPGVFLPDPSSRAGTPPSKSCRVSAVVNRCSRTKLSNGITTPVTATETGSDVKGRATAAATPASAQPIAAVPRHRMGRGQPARKTARAPIMADTAEAAEVVPPRAAVSNRKGNGVTVTVANAHSGHSCQTRRKPNRMVAANAVQIAAPTSGRFHMPLSVGNRLPAK